MAKSLVWVQKIASNPARAGFVGRVTTTVMIMIRKKMIAFETNIARMNNQFTFDKSRVHNAKNIVDGNENFPTNVSNPEVSRGVIKCVLPAM